MCRMMAKVSPAPSSIMDEMLHCPTSLHYLSENGRQPHAPSKRGGHNDGCGLAFVSNGTIEIERRDKEHAWDESYQAVVREAQSKIFIAHNRLASEGLNNSLDAAHPFFYQPGTVPYALSHNGGIKTFMAEARELGTSDSNIFLRHIVDAKEADPSRDFADIVTTATWHAEYNSLCAFLITSEEMWAWRVYNDTDKSKIPLYEAYYTLYLSFQNNAVLISSEPLDDGSWMLLPNKTFLSLKPAKDKVEIRYQSLDL